ncbi:MAG: electron transfer flavoprotein subunit beta/FixA family protein [Actinomycetia bacterium]|nr:electron transfer flavoprotein subunit beta/FixA family protein [Actinomycetes bacterium]
MKVLVCIKQVPGTTDIKIDPRTNTLIREGIENIINPFDSYALEEGARLKENQDFITQCMALTMGPPQAAQILKDAISLGMDEAVLLSDRDFAGADTWATAQTLAAAAKKIGDVALTVFGKQTLDGDTGQVGPEYAQTLGIPFVGYVSHIVDINKTRVRLKRLMEDRYETVEVNLPAAISVLKEINEPRVPSLRGKMKANKARIPVWDREHLGLSPEQVGLSGSYTQVVKVFIPQAQHEVMMLEGSPQEQVEKLFEKLKTLNRI